MATVAEFDWWLDLASSVSVDASARRALAAIAAAEDEGRLTAGAAATLRRTVAQAVSDNDTESLQAIAVYAREHGATGGATSRSDDPWVGTSEGLTDTAESGAELVVSGVSGAAQSVASALPWWVWVAGAVVVYQLARDRQ